MREIRLNNNNNFFLISIKTVKADIAASTLCRINAVPAKSTGGFHKGMMATQQHWRASHPHMDAGPWPGTVMLTARPVITGYVSR